MPFGARKAIHEMYPPRGKTRLNKYNTQNVRNRRD